jgi:NADPH:quinone reductase-like Zn-dependent oxidoreductase
MMRRDVGTRLRSTSLLLMRAVQITRFGGPEVLEIVDVPEPEAGDGQQLYDVSTAGLNFADTHQQLSRN